MVSQRRIPYVKVGRLVKFDVALLDTWIKQNTVMPMPQRRP
jgi:excisionase family DNA binding protein